MHEHENEFAPSGNGADSAMQADNCTSEVIGQETYTYDAEKLIACTAAAGEVTVYRYDANSRFVGVEEVLRTS